MPLATPLRRVGLTSSFGTFSGHPSTTRFDNGGIIRDILCGQIPLVFRAHINLYATAAMAGAVVYVLLARLQPGEPLNLLVGAGVILGLRLAALRWQIRLPELRAEDLQEGR